MSVSELRWAGSQAGGPAAHGKTAYLPYIDGLRAWAVLSVMLYHLDARWLPGGFAGVDIFFVISGFVVSVSVANRGPMSLGPFLLFFYARRMRRILPALVAALLATALVSTLFIPASYLSDRNRTTGLLAFFGLSNVILGAPGGDYFSPKAEFNPYTHTWSLGVEEQFYLLFPLLFHAWRAGGKRRYASAALFAAGLCASLAWSVWARPAMHAQAFYLIFGRFWELAAGVLLYQCVARAGRPAGRPAAAFGIEAGVWASAVAVLAGFVASKPALYPFPGALVPVAGALGLLGLLHGRARASPVRAALEQPALRFVGRISYSLYLWHWPVFVVFRWTLGLDSAGGKASALLAACALATASYRFIETPLRRGGAAARRAPRVAALAGGAGVLAAGAVLSSMLAAAQPQLSLSTVARHRLDWYPYGVETNAAYPGCVADVGARDVRGGKLWIYARKGCGRPPESRQRVFVIGDSHAMAYAGMFKQFVVRTGIAVYSYNNAGCPFVSLQPWRERGEPGCRRYGDAALDDMLSKLAPGDIVFLPSLRLPRFVTQWAFVGDDDARRLSSGREAAQVRERAIADAVAVLREIGRRGARIVLEAPPPVFRTVPYRCSDWFNRRNAICARGPLVGRGEIDALRAPVLTAYARIAAQVPDVHTWDPLPLLCDEKACSAYDGARPLFFDGDHLSGYGNLRVLPGFEAFVRELIEAA